MSDPRELPPVQLLVLARLLAAGGGGATTAALSKDLGPFVEHRWTGQDWAGRLSTAVEALESAGAVGHPRDKKGKPTRNVLLTDEGRRLALESLGIEGAPPALKWATIRAHLAALALGRPGPTPADLRRLTGAAPGLKAAALRERYDLTLDDPLDLPRARDAAAARLLGLEPDRPFKKDQILRALLLRAGVELPAGGTLKEADIQTALFRRELGDPRAKNPLDLIVARGVGARQNNAKELTDGLLRSWVDRREPRPAGSVGAPFALSAGPVGVAPVPGDAARTPHPNPLPQGGSGPEKGEVRPLPPPSRLAGEVVASPEFPSAQDDLPEFAVWVLEAARSSPTGWFGDAKVFIAHVWRAFEHDPAIRGLGIEGFKARLVEAHRARLLELGRADLVEAMDPADVRESATPYLNAVYHFVRTEGQPR